MAIKNLLEKDIKPLDIISKKSIENAIALVNALGGSTNAVLHFLAIAHAADIEITLRDFQRVSDKTPLNADLKTSGKNTTITRKNPLFPFVKRNGSLSFNLDYESPSYGIWEYDWRIGYETADKYDSWSSNGYERRFAKIAGSFYPVDQFKMGYEFRVREEDEWLNWIKDNELAVFDLSQKIISLNMNWYKGIKHEIRLKSQFVALEAMNPVSLITNSAGYLLNHNNDVKPFSEGITSFQVRYKYEIAPLSYIYLVYTKGGSVYDDENEKNTSSIFKDPWQNPDNEIFSLKFRLKY